MSGVVRIIRPKPSGSVTITENNTTVDVSKFAEALVQVPVEKGIVEATTDAEMMTFVDESEGGEIVKFTGTSSTYEKGRLYIVKGAKKEISFTVDIVVEGGINTYKANVGMTWGEWVESDYPENPITDNTWSGVSWAVDTTNNRITWLSGGSAGYIRLNGITVLPTDEIIADTEYGVYVTDHSG